MVPLRMLCLKYTRLLFTFLKTTTCPLEFDRGAPPTNALSLNPRNLPDVTENPEKQNPTSLHSINTRKKGKIAPEVYWKILETNAILGLLFGWFHTCKGEFAVRHHIKTKICSNWCLTPYWIIHQFHACFTMVFLKSGKIKQFYNLQLNGLMRRFLHCGIILGFCC